MIGRIKNRFDPIQSVCQATPTTNCCHDSIFRLCFDTASASSGPQETFKLITPRPSLRGRRFGIETRAPTQRSMGRRSKGKKVKVEERLGFPSTNNVSATDVTGCSSFF